MRGDESRAEDQFREATLSMGLGGPVDARSLGGLAAILDDYRPIGRRSLPPHVYFDYTASFGINAVAFSSKDAEFIAINAGALLAVYDTFMTLMSHPAVLPDVGRPSAGAVSLPALAWRISILRRGHVASAEEPPNWLEAIPDDPMRRAYALALAFSALDFLLNHELAHLEAGHLHWLGMHGEAALFERRAAETGFRRSDISQACEADADRAATSATLHRLHRIGDMLVTPRELCDRRYLDLLADPAHGYRVWAFATGMLFFLFGVGDTAPSTLAENRSHPHPLLRSLLANYFGSLHIGREAPDRQVDFRNGWDEADRELAAIWTQVAGQPFAEAFVGTVSDAEAAYSALVAGAHDVWPEFGAAARNRYKSLEAANT